MTGLRTETRCLILVFAAEFVRAEVGTLRARATERFGGQVTTAA